jgi:hypothetical protein
LWRGLLVALLLALGPWCAAHAADAASTRPRTWGQHGMVLFGGSEGLYASHMPMFHAPHDTQVVLRLHFTDPATEATVRHQLAGKTALWTIVPEDFELARLAPDAANPLREMQVDVVSGHFERGGKTRFHARQVAVDEVLMFRPLTPTMRQADSARYRLLGSGRERFLLKEIDARPDMDVLVALAAAAGAGPTPAGATVTLPQRQLVPPSPASVQAALRTATGQNLRWRGVVYFETGDLK